MIMSSTPESQVRKYSGPNKGATIGVTRRWYAATFKLRLLHLDREVDRDSLSVIRAIIHFELITNVIGVTDAVGMKRKCPVAPEW
jgi:hypothetical protein